MCSRNSSGSLVGALNPVQCPLMLRGVTYFDVIPTKELGLGAGGRTVGKSPWYVGCMCRETATPWSWAELGVGEPCLCTQHWTDGTQRPCLLLGRGGVFEGLQPAPASVSSAAHRHRPQGSEHDHVTSGGFPRHLQLFTSSPWEEGSSGPGRAGSPVTSCFGSLPWGTQWFQKLPWQSCRQDSSSRYRDPPGKERLELKSVKLRGV